MPRHSMAVIFLMCRWVRDRQMQLNTKSERMNTVKKMKNKRRTGNKT